MPRLRLDLALGGLAAPAESPGKLALPVGELNRGGIVRARYLRVRDGAFFLVGGYADYEGAEHMAGDDALRH